MPSCTVLLVEDNADDRALALRALGKADKDVEVVTANDGADALEALGLRSGSHRPVTPDLILLDLKLPKLGGVEVLQQIKSNPDFVHIPVVVLTSSDEETDLSECYRLGVNSYIVKPVDYSQFVTKMAEIVRYWLYVNRAPGIIAASTTVAAVVFSLS